MSATWDGLRLLRGRALIRRDAGDVGHEYRTPGGVIVPATAHNPRDVKIHRGTLLAVGPCAATRKGHPTPWECAPGDVVWFVFAQWLERIRSWDGLAVVSQAEIVAVEEPGS